MEAARRAVLRSVQLKQLGLLALCVGLWEAVSRSGTFSPLLFPPLSAMAGAFAESLIGGEFARHLSRTLWEIAGALMLAMGVGLPVGVVIGSFKSLRAVFQPLLIVAFCIPLATLIPLFIVLFGIEMKSKIVFGAIYGFFPIALTTISSVASVDRTLLMLGKALGARPALVLTKIVLPAALPGVVAGIEQGVSLVIIGTIAAEMFASAFGLGYLIEYSFTLFEIPKVYAMAFVTLIIAFGLNVGFRRVLELFLARAHHYQPSIGR